MGIEEIKRIIKDGKEEEKNNLRDYFKKYGNTLDKEKEIHEIFVNTLLRLSKEEIIKLSGIIGYPVFLRIALYPEIRHSFPLLQDGASLILLDDENNVLVQQRMDNGKYGFSGGCQELGEELTDVGIRECYEETGLLIDKDKVIDLCEVSGLSRKNSYPNGDVVVNNTALHIGYLRDCKGSLHKDFESKQVMFKPLSFLESLSEEQQHEKDFIMILKRYLNGENVNLKQELLELTKLPDRRDESLVSYMLRLTPEERIILAKNMGYENFLLQCIDERIRGIFPHLVDKGVLVAIRDEEILVIEKDGAIMLPKKIQSVGESFENLLATSFGISIDNLNLVTRLSGEKMYNGKENVFYNTMIFKANTLVRENEYLRYMSIGEAYNRLSNEDRMYYDAYNKLGLEEHKKLSK